MGGEKRVSGEVLGASEAEKWASRRGAVLFLDISVDGCLRVMLRAREEGRMEPQGRQMAAKSVNFREASSLIQKIK